MTGDPADDREHHRGRATEHHRRDEIESDRAAPILPQRHRQPVEQGAVGDRPVPEPLVQVQPPRIRIAGAAQDEQRRRDEADERGDHQGERRIRERKKQCGGRDQDPVGAGEGAWSALSVHFDRGPRLAQNGRAGLAQIVGAPAPDLPVRGQSAGVSASHRDLGKGVTTGDGNGLLMIVGGAVT